VAPSATPTSPLATATAEPASPTATTAATATATPSATPTPSVTPGQVSCVLTPQQTLGPFFIDVGLVRTDVREDRQGIELRLALQLVDADGCAPIRDAVVNIWHADAAGAYSGFPNQPGGIDTTGETFLRGYQVTDADGRVGFTTIYPGWYTGRTVHIHVRVHLDSTTVLVSQVYSPDALTALVHTQAPYSERGQPTTTNETDAIARNGLEDLLLDVVEDGPGYAASIVLGAAL
jgi:protocatechuate 3,4-dioxygenase beta subunit